MDMVATCPKGFWKEWIAEGDPAGTVWSGTDWSWYTGGRRPDIAPGDRLYVVAHGRLRGFAPVTAVEGLSFDPAHGAKDGHGVYVDVNQHPREYRDGVLSEKAVDSWRICRRGDAVAVTIHEQIPGFRGLRRRWWPVDQELPFSDWKTKGVA